MPTRWLSVYAPVNARSVPALRSTAYSSGLSSARHWSSVLVTDGAGRSLVRRMCTTVPSGRYPVVAVRTPALPGAQNAEDAVQDRRRGAEQDQPDHDLRRRTAGTGE